MDPSAKERRYDRRKREIIDAAAKVFAEKGFHGASTKDIAVSLGIQQGSLYHYFRSKSEALEEVCRVGVEGFVAGARAILQSEMTSAEKISAAIANHLLPMKTRQDYVVVFINERHHVPKPKRRRVEQSSAQYEEIIERIFSEGRTTGDLAADLDPHLAMLSMIGLCNSATPWLRRSSVHRVEDVIEMFSVIMTHGLVRR
ncbi:MAG: TetR/AcrR family transcriptional regulator [Fimbriimonadaceae bacterium]|nr:TetR/AcrR family transcriptional regulator [Alphaproteobacteria bacterium]